MILALVLAAGAAAWVFSSRTEATPPRRTAPSPAELAERLPFFGILYARTASEVQVAEAQRQLGIDCMTRHGFSYRPAPVAGAAGPVQDRPTAFGLESLTAPRPAVSSPAPTEESPDPAFTRALFGDPDERISAAGKTIRVSRPADGCLAEAEKRLLGADRLRWLQLRIQLGDGEKEARQQLDKDPRFRTATDRWRRCLHTAGYDHKDPVALMYSLPRGTDPARSPLVRADLRCKQDTDYLTTAYTRLEAAQTTWLRQHSTLLTEWKTLQLRRQDNARQVLGTDR
ncbi:hypothetical protein ACSCBZ_18455 [Streptomyces niveiscabiei]|uniref:hypothetical protein n=1 Tax=Streptomyces TaxID=1883 RepID=UPI00105830DC|nr:MULTISPECIES: hypothetical protein [Streptomyces]